MTTTTASPASPHGAGPCAAQWTAESKFSLASEEPRSDERCEPTKAIRPGGVSPFPAQAKLKAAEEMCKVSVPWVTTTPSHPSSKACFDAWIIEFQCCGRMSSLNMFPSLTASIRARLVSSGKEAMSSSGSKRATTAPVA